MEISLIMKYQKKKIVLSWPKRFSFCLIRRDPLRAKTDMARCHITMRRSHFAKSTLVGERKCKSDFTFGMVSIYNEHGVKLFTESKHDL